MLGYDGCPANPNMINKTGYNVAKNIILRNIFLTPYTYSHISLRILPVSVSYTHLPDCTQPHVFPDSFLGSGIINVDIAVAADYLYRLPVRPMTML